MLVWSNVLGIGSCGFVLSLLASVLTVSYSVKLIFWTFFSSSYQGLKSRLTGIHPIAYLEMLVLGCLSLFSIFIGFIMRDRFIGLASGYLVPVLADSNIYCNSEFLSPLYKVIILLTLIFGLSFAFWLNLYWSTVYYWFLSFWTVELSWVAITCSKFFICKLYFYMLFNQYVASVVLDFGYKSFWVWYRWIL